MKQRILLLTGFLLLLLQGTMAEEYNNIAVSGTIHNPKNESVRIVLYSYVPGQNDISSTALLEGGGSFHFVSYIREPVFARIFYGSSSFPLYLEPGYDLRLSFNGDQLEQSLEFSGVGAKNNTFLAKRLFQFSLDSSHLLDKIKKTELAAYTDWATRRKNEQEELLLGAKEELSSGFVAQQEYDIAYNWANELFAYAQYGEEHPRKVRIPEDFYDFMDEVKLHNYEVIRLQSYRSFLDNYLLYNYGLMKSGLSDEKNSYYSNMYKVARQSLRSHPMYHMQAAYLVKALNYLGVDYVTDEYIEFANECPVQVYKNVLHKMVKEQTVSPKEPEVVFTDERGRTIPLKELSGNIVLMRFTNYLTDSASQLIRTHDQELKQTLSSYRDVHFLQLPMSDNKEAYEKMVYADATEYLKSIMNRPKPGQEKPKAPPFSYILLNRDGLVVSNSLDDPKNELALEKIDALIRQEKRNLTIE
jgi:hypothetical protein